MPLGSGSGDERREEREEHAGIDENMEEHADDGRREEQERSTSRRKDAHLA